MRVAVMGRILRYDGSGIQRLLVGLLQAVAHLDHAPDILVFLEPDQPIPEMLAGGRLGFVRLRARARTALSRLWWDHVLVGRACHALGVDVLYAPAHVRPAIAPCPVVVMVPDMMYHRFPELWSWSDQAYFRLMLSTLTRRAAEIVALSEHTRLDLVSVLRVPSEHVSVVYPGVPDGFQPIPQEEWSRVVGKYELHMPFILFVGSFHRRKNVKGLIDAFAQIAGQVPHELVIVGSRWPGEDVLAHAQRSGATDRIRFLHYVPEPDLVLLYNAADMFAYPSLYEGFGFPVLEAMACGCPTVATLTSSIPEVAGEGALLVPPGDVPALASALCRLANDPGQKARLAEQGLVEARRFSWTRAAGQMAEVWARAGSRRPASRAAR